MQNMADQQQVAGAHASKHSASVGKQRKCALGAFVTAQERAGRVATKNSGLGEERPRE